MTTYSSTSVIDRLPSESGLRTSAQQLRDLSSNLSSRSSAVTSVADALTPAVWSDSSSGHVRSVLQSIASELGTGSSAASQSADALDNLASYVTGKRPQYETLGSQLAQLPHGLNAGQDFMTSMLGLSSERQSIERDVQTAMTQAADTINGCAAKASRFQYKHSGSMWSHIGDFFSGLWDGTEGAVVGIGKVLLALGELQAKLSPERALVDPKGYVHDLEHFSNSVEQFVSATVHNPGQFVESLLNLQELKKDPVHWVGMMLPGIVAAIATDGGSEAADGAGLAGEGVESAGLGGTSDIGRLALKLSWRDENISGPWVLEGRDFQKFTSVIQTYNDSCVAASCEMLTHSPVTQEEFYNFFGRGPATTEMAAEALGSTGGDWTSIQFQNVEEIDRYLNDGPIGIAVPGHMMVLDKLLNGSYLVRDPWWPGFSYTVDINWLQKWVIGGVVR